MLDPPITGPELYQVQSEIMRNLYAAYGRHRPIWEDLSPNWQLIYDRLAEYINTRCYTANRFIPVALPELAQEVFQ